MLVLLGCSLVSPRRQVGSFSVQIFILHGGMLFGHAELYVSAMEMSRIAASLRTD
jgi:hypothetical protein